MKNIAITLTLLALVVSFTTPAAAYDVYKNTPDVDKSQLPPLPGDKSCWQACAANLLGGGGWGLTANTQQNADAIYGHMTAHFTTANPGKPEIAVNWWLYNYGYNPDAVGGWYQPSKTYNDVTVVGKSLVAGDYDFLLDELTRCQYVSVSWEFSDGMQAFYHCLTLVGGNYSGIHVPPGNPLQSVWHDSDRDNGGNDDDVYNNTFAGGGGSWSINYPNATTSNAYKYVTLCPGEQKPASAMENYDAAWHRDYDGNGNEIQVWRIAGTNKNWGNPTWDPHGQGNNTLLQIPNEVILDKHKIVHLLVDYKDRNYDPNSPSGAPDIILEDDQGNVVTNLVITISADGGQILYTWTMDDQPPFERIIFPNTDYFNLSGDVKDFNVATECVPEPMTMSLLLIGGLAILRRRGRK